MPLLELVRRLRRPRLAPIVLAAVALSMACIQGAKAPQVPPNGTLSLGDPDRGPLGHDGPFAVVFGSPKGQTGSPSEISLVFNRPMRALELAGDEARAPATLKPDVKGRWSWVGTSGLVFVPEDRLPRATDYVVEVPAGTRALGGETLEKPYVLRFTTERPAVAHVTPPSGSNFLEPADKFTVHFNQPIDDAELKRAVSLAAADKPVAFDLRRPEPESDQIAALVPRAPLPLDAEIVLKVDGSLRGSEGPLPASEPEIFRFHTYGPLTVARTSCDTDTPNRRCSVSGGLNIELSNRVKLADIKKALQISPPIKITWPSWLDDDDLTRNVAIGGRFAGGRTYTVKIRPGIKDEYGQALAREWTHDHVVDDLWPSAEIGVSGSYFEPVARRDIPVASVNVAALDLATAPLDEDAVLALESNPDRDSRAIVLAEIAGLKGARVQKLSPAAAVNAPAVHPVRIEDTLGGKDARGPMAIGIGYTSRPTRPEARAVSRAAIVQVTDLAVSAKISPHGSVVWVTRLSSAAPVEGASVYLRRHGVAGPADVFLTDKSGLATIPKDRFSPARNGGDRAVIFVRLGQDWAYRRVADSMNGWRFGIEVQMSEDGPFGMLFTDRGIYRPGDSVRIKGILRQEAHPGTTTPVGKHVELKVEGPDGNEITKLTRALSAFGTFAVDVKVPETGRLGTYSIAARVDGSPHDWPDANGDFEVAEYRPAEFKVAVESDRPSYVRGDKASWTARGDLLFGSPMANAPVRFTVTRGTTSFSPPGVEGFATGEEVFRRDLQETSPRGYEVASRETKLDTKGAAALAETLTMPGQRGPELVTAEAEVTDVSRQAIAASSTALVHPGEFYVALNPGKELFVKPGQAVAPEILAVDPKGARIAGVKVAVDLVRRTWTVARQQTGGSGHHNVSTAVDKVVATCAVTTASAPATCSLLPPSAGYYILHASAADRRGNKVAAAASLYVTGEAEMGWSDDDDAVVELTPDRKSYEIGQTARILVKSPFKSADALVTVERAGVYTQRRLTLAGAMPTIDVPITDDLRPNAFVSVLLVRGRTKPPPGKPRSPDIGAPEFRMGYAPLPVNPESRRLKVALKSNKSDYRPGDPINVDLEVRDREGKPARAEVTLYAVDEGVLSLIGYKTPDPVPVFTAPRALQVLTVESREALARVFTPFRELGFDKGLDGGGGSESSGARRDFRASAYYNPALVTDAAGRIHVSFKLPEGLTTYRLMAVAAAEDDRFGYVESRVTTSRPLMARPAFPRILRAGDRIDAGLIVTSKGLEKSTVGVEIVAEGLTLSGESRRSIELGVNESTEVRFALAATTVGKAKVRFRVKGGGAEDHVEITRDVIAPQLLEAAALYGDTSEASAEKLGDLSAIRTDVGGLEVSLSSSALVGLDNGVDQLLEYPYGCTEQLVSRLVPLLPLRDLSRDYGITLPADVDKVVVKTIADILARQRGDGGFGLWADSPETNGWVSAYALWGLGEAKRRGIQVPASAIEQATRYVRGALERERQDDVTRATAAFIVDVLAQNGAPDPGRVSRLFEERKKLPVFAQALLAHAMVLGKSDRASIDRIVSELEGSLRIDGPHARAVVNTGDRYAVIMDSQARTSALTLRALVAARPAHPMASRLAMGLIADRRGGTWRSTQETAWALLSLDDYRRAQEKVAPDFIARVFLGEAELYRAPFKGRSLAEASTTIPPAQLASVGGSTLAFSVDGEGRLFYEARLRYARKEMPRQPLERGFFVKKTLRPVTPESLDEALKIVPERSIDAFLGGDLVMADIVVVTPSPREFVVIDDPLPAGFEAIDARLATSAGSLDVDDAEERGDDDEGDSDDDDVAQGRAYLPSWYLRELRDDRVLFFVDHMAAGMYRYRYLARATTHGAFIVPPTKAEEMYTPEVFGRTGSAVITVAPKK